MPRTVRRIVALLLLVCLLPAGALALSGQTMATFTSYYRDNVAFINSVTERHMLPIELEESSYGTDGHMQYAIQSDALHVTVITDGSGIIESCEIRLLFPQGAVEGNSLYLDYVSAQYHSIAFIMSMHVSPDPESRLLLAEEIKNGMLDNFGAYERQLGAYTIQCIGVPGEGAVYTFTNTSLVPAQDEPSDGDPTPEPLDDFEHLG